MAEVAPAIVHALGRNILLDTPDAVHEAGDLLEAGVDPDGLPTLLDEPDRWPLAFDRTVLFKSCGSALWDLSAARVLARPPTRLTGRRPAPAAPLPLPPSPPSSLSRPRPLPRRPRSRGLPPDRVSPLRPPVGPPRSPRPGSALVSSPPRPPRRVA